RSCRRGCGSCTGRLGFFGTGATTVGTRTAGEFSIPARRCAPFRRSMRSWDCEDHLRTAPREDATATTGTGKRLPAWDRCRDGGRHPVDRRVGHPGQAVRMVSLRSMELLMAEPEAWSADPDDWPHTPPLAIYRE